MLVVVENNRYAQSTPLTLNFSGSFTGRIKCFGISVGEIETNDVEELYLRFEPIIEQVRNKQLPHVEIVHTYRLGPHSTGDDHRPREEINAWREKDPLAIIAKRMTESELQAIEAEVVHLLATAEMEVRQMPFPIATKDIGD